MVEKESILEKNFIFLFFLYIIDMISELHYMITYNEISY